MTSDSNSDSDDDDSSISGDETMSSSSYDDGDPHEDPHLLPPPPPRSQIPQMPRLHHPLWILGVETDPDDEEDDDDDNNGPPHTNDTAEDIPVIDAAAAPPSAIDEYENDESSDAASLELPPSKHEWFKAAEEAGRAMVDFKASKQCVSMQKRQSHVIRHSSTCSSSSCMTKTITTTSSLHKCLPRKDYNSLDKKESTC